MTCSLCSSTTFAMFTVAPSIRRAMGGEQGAVVLCWNCNAKYRRYEVDLPIGSRPRAEKSDTPVKEVG